MEMNVIESAKCVCIWLRNDEKNDAALRERLKPVYEKYHARKYTVCVFESGSGDLYENTKALLLLNRRRVAERAVQAANGSPAAGEK